MSWESVGALKFDVNGTEVELTKEDLLIDMAQKPGYVSEADNYTTVVLDTNLSEAAGERALYTKSSARSRLCVRMQALK